MKKMKFKFLNIFLLLTLNGINVFGMMNEKTINETQMSTEDFLNEIYKDLSEMQRTFQLLITLKNSTNILKILYILAIIKAKIDNKKQFENKTPTEILMTNIDFRLNINQNEYNNIKTYINQDNDNHNQNKNYKLFLDENIFKKFIQDTSRIFLDNKKYNSFLFTQIYSCILKYLITMENFIISSKEQEKKKGSIIILIQNFKDCLEVENDTLIKFKDCLEVENDTLIKETDYGKKKDCLFTIRD